MITGKNYIGGELSSNSSVSFKTFKIAFPNVDLPEPDSPTIPIVSPVFNVKVTLFTAVTTLPSVWNSVTKFLNSNKVFLIFSEN